MSEPTAHATLLVRCPLADAFDAFADPRKITQFWLASASGALCQGAKVAWEFMVPGARESVEVTAFCRPHRIAFKWSDGVNVELDFKEHAAGETVVAVAAKGFAGEDACRQAIGATEGFSIVLCDLKTYLETGRSAQLVRDKARLITEQRSG